MFMLRSLTTLEDLLEVTEVCGYCPWKEFHHPRPGKRDTASSSGYGGCSKSHQLVKSLLIASEYLFLLDQL